MRTTPANAATGSVPAARVSTFELFFDLVFVLTIIRVGAVLHEEPDLLGLAAMLLILITIWRIYAGYAWLTSRVDATGLGRRLILSIATGGFLVMALAAPHAFGVEGLLFALAYLVVVAVYLGLIRAAFPHEAPAPSGKSRPTTSDPSGC